MYVKLIIRAFFTEFVEIELNASNTSKTNESNETYKFDFPWNMKKNNVSKIMH